VEQARKQGSLPYRFHTTSSTLFIFLSNKSLNSFHYENRGARSKYDQQILLPLLPRNMLLLRTVGIMKSSKSRTFIVYEAAPLRIEDNYHFENRTSKIVQNHITIFSQSLSSNHHHKPHHFVPLATKFPSTPSTSAFRSTVPHTASLASS
jgi:hypothetical protein